MEAVAVAALLVLPGAWIAFATRDGAVSFGARLAWAAALAPMVAAGEFFLARRAAGSFFQTAWLVAALNAPAVILIWKRWRTRIPSAYANSEWEMWRGVLVYAAVAACTILPWWASDVFRTYSWHGLLHLDVIYSIALNGVPREAELAGVPLSYPWAPHVAWALEAAAAQKSPTLLYPVNNLLLLAAAGMLAYELARSLGASKSLSTATAAFLALGPNLPGLIGWSIVPPNDDGATWALLGDLRYTPFLLKFVTFDSMPLGMTLMLGLALSGVSIAKQPRRQEMLLLGAGIAAMAALYPNLYPAAAALAAGVAAVVIRRAMREPGMGAVAADVAGWACAGLIVGFFLIDGYSHGRTQPPVELSPLPGLGRKAVSALVGLGPFALGAFWFWRLRPERRGEMTVLAIGAAGALACNLLLRLGGLNEYKFYSAAGLLLVPPALAGAALRFPALGRKAGWLTWGSAAALLAVMSAYARQRLPDQTATARAVDERSFFVSLAPGDPDGRWLAAVRVKSDEDAVLVVDRPELHVSAFTARRLLVGSERARPHAGCNQPTRFNLVDLRGYDPVVVDRRLKLLDAVYRPHGPQSDEQNQALLEAIAAEVGPELAFVFLPGDDRSYLTWLREERHARVLYDDGKRTVVAP
ncbi:MAG: hypothetical protein H6509_15290 [Bryobacterales bacterium]|nr:hypothetical protein [Bryobacterales bacterium]